MTRWIPHTKGGPGKPSWEIAVIREDNAHGIASYGWFDGRKVFVGSSGGPCNDVAIAFVWERLVKIAEDLAALLNTDEYSTSTES